MSLSSELNAILSDLRAGVPEIRGALVASSDGMAVASNTSGGDTNRMAAMVATALGLGKRICDTFGGGGLNETSVAGSDGHVYIYSAGAAGVLAVITASDVNVGLINIECRDAAKKISGKISA